MHTITQITNMEIPLCMCTLNDGKPLFMQAHYLLCALVNWILFLKELLCAIIHHPKCIVFVGTVTITVLFICVVAKLTFDAVMEIAEEKNFVLNAREYYKDKEEYVLQLKRGKNKSKTRSNDDRILIILFGKRVTPGTHGPGTAP